MKDAIVFIATHVGLQLLACVGIFFVFGFVLSNIQTTINNQYRRVWGWKGILWTAWIGTPIHELSHAALAWMFHHKIHRISLFAPNEDTGGLGQVDHSFERLSIFQRMGNFFIGAAPMITGPVVLMILLYLFIPDAKKIFIPITAVSDLSSLGKISLLFLKQIFFSGQFTEWKFWVFLYLSFCVSCHMAPSKADLKNMMSGFVWVIGLLILINGAALFFDILLSAYLPAMYRYLHVFTSLYIYATLLSILHLTVVCTIFSLFTKKSYASG